MSNKHIHYTASHAGLQRKIKKRNNFKSILVESFGEDCLCLYADTSGEHQSNCKDLNTSGSDAHINVRIRIVNKHRNVADKLGWEPRRKYATARFSIGFCALETNSSRDRTDIHCYIDGM